MQKWEYFVAPLLEHNPAEILNTFGDDGWELVSAVDTNIGKGSSDEIVLFLKRPVG